MEERTLVSREIVEGYVVDDEIGFSVAIVNTRELEFDPENIMIPAWT